MKDKWTDYRAYLVSLTLLLIAAAVTADPGLSQVRTSVAEGMIYDADSGNPIPYATIQVINSDRSTLANDEGKYRVILQPGETQLRFSHIAYFSHMLDLNSDSGGVGYDVYLKTCMVDLGVMKVYSRQYDPGQQIIVEAIRRKQDILARLHDYRCDAYTKMVVYDESGQDSSHIWLLTETQVTTYWEQPDKYKEVVTARRQSANIQAEGNLVTVGEIRNFNRNRIELDRYSMVSPTAEDALDFYNYYLLDTVYIDSLAVFRLEIEPKNPDQPLFAGFIHIADSTFDVVDVDVGFSRAVHFPLFDSLRYAQRFARFENDYWMPIEVRFSGKVQFEVSLPGIPKKLRFAHIASLYSYQFEVGHPKGTFNDYIVEVDRRADDVDSAAWSARQTIPLTAEEIYGYRRIDSLESRPKSPGQVALMGLGAAAALLIFGNQDLFRFNRVEGPYLGIGLATGRLHERLKLRVKTGYAFDAKRSQHQVGLTWRFQEKRRLELGFDYYDRVIRRPTAISPASCNPTVWVLAAQRDALDYFRAEGLEASFSFKPLNYTRLTLSYGDFEHYSLPARSTFSLFGDTADVRDNPAVAEGRMRSVAAEFVYDSRHMLKSKGRELRLNEAEFLRIRLGIEHAAPEFIDNDFDFRRYYADIRRHQRTLGLGMTVLRLYAGSSDDDLPPQRYHTVDFGNGMLYNANGFSTLNETNFVGGRALVILAHHDFRRRLFVVSGLPLIRDIPFWLSVHGGAFWSEFRNHPYQSGDEQTLTAKRPYREIGFGLGNLTPFMAPFNLACYFTWQLSDYETSDFSIDLGIDL